MGHYHEHTPIDDLVPYVNNARTHSDDQVAQIAASIREFGFTNPVLIDENSNVIAGHGRIAAARKLKLDAVPTLTLEGLTEAQRKAYVIADNQLALNAGWDDAMLALEVEQLTIDEFNIDVLGLDAELSFDALDDEPSVDLSETLPQWVSCPECGKEFDAKASA